MTTKKPELLNDKDLDQVRGGACTENHTIQGTLHAVGTPAGPKPGQEGFIPSAGTSRMD